MSDLLDLEASSATPSSAHRTSAPAAATPLSGEDEAQARFTERVVLLVLAAVQFTSIVDFVVVMPLGPTLMRSLQIGPAEFGLIVSSYTFAAGLAGLVASSVVDRFSRRQVMIWTDLARVAVALMFLLVTSAEDLWIAYIATVLLSTFGAFFDGAKNATTPNLTGRDGILAGTALMFSTRFLLMAIGSGLGVQNKYNLLEIVENATVPIIVDAGVGTASDAAIAMELGCDGVLMNTAIAGARDPVLMAHAMKLAVEAGRAAFKAGRIPRKRFASASSPIDGLVA